MFDSGRRSLLVFSFLVVLIFLALPSMSFSQVGKGSPDFTASNLLKILTMEEKISKAGRDISIYIMDDPSLATALQNLNGSSLGSSKLGKVSQGGILPRERFDIIYIGDPDRFLTDPAGLKDILAYTQDNKSISVTHELILIYKGVSLGIGDENGLPKFFINLKSAQAEGLKWTKAAIKIAETV